MDEIKKFWSETMEMTEARWIVAIAGLVICVATAFYVVKFLRDMALGKVENSASYMGNFQRLREEGKLDDDEFAKLAQVLPKETSPETSKEISKLLGGQVAGLAAGLPDNNTPDFTVDDSNEDDGLPDPSTGEGTDDHSAGESAT